MGPSSPISKVPQSLHFPPKMEPWEALDVDDSDLPSLLRPCKQSRLHHHIPQTTTTCSAAAAPPSQSQQLPSQAITQKLSTQQHSQHHSNPNNPNRLIPGPAGPVQAAMLRKARDREGHNFDESNPIPTQEYIRKAVENATPEFDHDFQANPWLSALQFLGMADGVLPSTPLISIKKWANGGKVDKVVAVIKSCTSNGLGGLMVTLKDTTGTVGASIHHRVLSESEFGKDISLGSVLILQKVAVFGPSPSVYYLNITLGNLVKVFSKRSSRPSKQNCPANAIRYSTSNSDYCGKANRTDNISTLGRGTTKEILEDMRRYTDKRKTVQGDSRSEQENILPGSLECGNKVTLNQTAAVEREAPASRQEGAEVIFVDKIAEENGEYNKGYMGAKYNPPKEGNLEGSLSASIAATNSITNNADEESVRADKVQKQTLPVISNASLPQWTDEQLKELFASDGEDDGIMF